MRQFLSAILYITIGLPLTIATLLSFSFRPFISDKEFCKEALTDDRLYALISDPASWKNVNPVLVRDGYHIDTKAFAAAIQNNLPSSELKTLAIHAIDEAFDAFGPKPQDGTLDLDLRPLKSSIRLSIPALARGYISALPVSDAAGEPHDLSFRATSLSIPNAEKAARSAFGIILETVPDRVSEPVIPPRIPSAGRVGIKLFNPLSTNTTATGFAFASTLVITALAFLGSLRGTERLKRAGRYIIIPSVIVMMAGGFLYLPGAPALRAFLPAGMAEVISSANTTLLSGYLSSVFEPLARHLFFAGLVGASIGGALVSSRRILEPKED